jgi:peptidoglycan/LPS O-acetylase OafA/YrhL
LAGEEGDGARGRSDPAVTPPRLVALDLLRALAVLLVLGRHGKGFEDVPVLAEWRRGGWVGVDLFFVLSGFLVGGLLFSELTAHGRVALGQFLVRRGLKIYPAFYVLLALTLAAQGPMGEAIPPQRIAAEALYLQNYLRGVWGHTWSLAVEEHFYLLLAALFGWSGRRTWIVAGVAGLALPVCLGLRILAAEAQPEFQHHAHLAPTHLRIDALLLGCLLSYWWHVRGGSHRRRSPAATWLLATLGLSLLSLLFLFELGDGALMHTLGLTTNGVGSACLLLALLHLRPGPSRAVGLLAALGTRSYSIYLWHLPVQKVVAIGGERLGLGFCARTVAYLLGSVVVGVTMAALVELPLLRLRDRVFPRR